ncbi:MAG: bifunctional riboflavin kinase/FAD synthetase [Caldilineaceae bacterium]|nr:bifunctional riboflavin kinase/FAD synthetase [Caldilineaceae bacterium]
MQKFVDLTQMQLSGPSFVTIGNFDGLHRGHQALLRKVREAAQQAYATGAVQTLPQSGFITFDPHPLAVLRPALSHSLLTTPSERLALAEQIGIDFGVIQPFTTAIAQLEAREFIELLKRHIGLAGLVVGPDFALGRGRKGDLAALRELGQELGYTLHVMDPITWGERPVRSSTIRQALQQGDVATAADLLGRFYTIQGKVITGDQRGRLIGVPTANLQIVPHKLLPAYGVYATRSCVQLANGPCYFHSVTNLGVRPTVDGQQQRLETHLFDFPPANHSGDLYGELLSIEFIARLRDEQRFSSIDNLIAQIRLDIEHAHQLLQGIALGPVLA